MNNIINLNSYIQDKKFDENVLSFFKTLNVSFQHYREEKEALGVIKAEAYIFIFMAYIENNTHTRLPTVQDRFYDIKENPRVSKGEWVVDAIYELDRRDAKKLISKLNTQDPTLNGITDLKNKIKE